MGIEQGTYATPRLDLGVALEEHPLIPRGLIGLELLPVWETQLKKGTFSGITRASITRTRETRREAGTAYSRGGFETEDISYECDEHALEAPLDDSERRHYATSFDAEMVCASGIQGSLMRAQEIRIATAVFNTTTFTGASLYTDVSAAPWDAAGSDVIGHVDAAKSLVIQNCGLVPDTLAVSYAHLQSFKANTAIKAAIQYTARTTEAEILAALADLFGIQRVLLGSGVKNTADEGQSASMGWIWSDDYAMLCVTAQGNVAAVPGLGRSVLWAADSPENVTVEQYREEQIRSDVFRVRQNVDEKIVDPYFGHLLKIDA